MIVYIIIVVVWLLSLNAVYTYTKYSCGKILYDSIIDQLSSTYSMIEINLAYNEIIDDIKANGSKGWDGTVYVLIAMNQEFRDRLQKYCDEHGFDLKIYYSIFDQQRTKVKITKKQDVSRGENA